MTNYQGKDGWERNRLKLKHEWQKVKPILEYHREEWQKEPTNMHHWVDMFVEPARISPYFTGHVWSIYFPVSLLAIVTLSAALIWQILS